MKQAEEADDPAHADVRGGPTTPVAPWNHDAELQDLADRAVEATFREMQARAAGPWRRRSSSGRPHRDLGPYVVQTAHEDEVLFSPTAVMAQPLEQQPKIRGGSPSQAWLEDPSRPIRPLTTGEVKIRKSLGMPTEVQEPPHSSGGPPLPNGAVQEDHTFVTKANLDSGTNTILGALNTGFGDIKRVQEQQQEQIRALDESARSEAAKRSQQIYDLELKFEEMMVQPQKQRVKGGQSSGGYVADESPTAARRRD